jgi:hypothetical protein
MVECTHKCQMRIYRLYHSQTFVEIFNSLTGICVAGINYLLN